RRDPGHRPAADYAARLSGDDGSGRIVLRGVHASTGDQLAGEHVRVRNPDGGGTGLQSVPPLAAERGTDRKMVAPGGPAGAGADRAHHLILRVDHGGLPGHSSDLRTDLPDPDGFRSGGGDAAGYVRDPAVVAAGAAA